jgi:hypothetical protein
MGTKNNPKNRVKNLEKKKHNNKEVEPVLYFGMHSGHGKYVSGKYCGSANLVVDSSGKPLPWDQI